jgi:cytochrome c biogenesis protein CcdA
VTGVLADWVQDGLGSWWAPGLAFAAGVISFASPCVFPLVPGYLSFVAGGEVRD